MLLIGGCSYLAPGVETYKPARTLDPIMVINADGQISSDEPLNRANAEWIHRTCPGAKFEIVDNSIKHTSEGIVIEKIRCLSDNTVIDLDSVIVFSTD